MIPGAASADVRVKSVFALPVDPSPLTSVPAGATPDGVTVEQLNQRYLCTPERRGLPEYLTHDPFDVKRGYVIGNGLPGDPGYATSNVPSADDLTPQLDAGGNADLCFGFTLTPNMQPDAVRNTTPSTRPRLNTGNPPLADDPTPASGRTCRSIPVRAPSACSSTATTWSASRSPCRRATPARPTAFPSAAARISRPTSTRRSRPRVDRP